MKALKRSTCPVVVALAMLLAACGGSDDDGASSAQDGSPAQSAAASVADGLTIGIAGPGQPTDPSSTGMGNISVWASGNVYEYLFDREAGTDKLVPGLAKSWKQSKDGKTIDIELRDGVTFHSGDPFTAADLKFTWDRLVEFDQAARYSSTLEKVEIVDDHMVRLSFAAPDVGFIAGGGFPVQSKAFFEQEGEKKFASTPIGTGPYEVTDVKPGETITMEPFKDYWGETGRFPRVEWRFVNDESTRANLLLSGDADMIGQIPPALVQQVEENDDLTIVKQDPGGYSVWMQGQFLDAETPWADRRVRKAMSLAIDEQALVEDVLSGAAAHYPGLAKDDIGYDPDLQSDGIDVEAAKQLLADAGYPDGFDMELPYMTGVLGGMDDTASSVVLYLQQVGIDAKAKPYEAPQFREFAAGAARNPDKDYMALFAGTIAGMVEPTVALMTHFSDKPQYARYFNDDVTALLMKASATLDADARAEPIADAMRAVNEDVAFVPLWTNINHYGMRNGLTFTPTRGNYEQFQLDDVEVEG